MLASTDRSLHSLRCSPRSTCAPRRGRKASTTTPTPWCGGPRHRGPTWPWGIIPTHRPTSCTASHCCPRGRCARRVGISRECAPTPRPTENSSRQCGPPWPRSTTTPATKRASTSPGSLGRGERVQWANEGASLLLYLCVCRDKPRSASSVDMPLARRLKMTSPALAVQEDLGALRLQRDTSCKGSWGYQWCTEMTQPFTQGTDRDFFFCPNGTFYRERNCSQWVRATLAEPCPNRCPHRVHACRASAPKDVHFPGTSTRGLPALLLFCLATRMYL